MVQYPQKALLKISVLLESVEQNVINLKKNNLDLKKFIQEDFKGENELQSVKKEVELLKGKIDRTMENGEKTVGLNQMDIVEKGVGVRGRGVGI